MPNIDEISNSVGLSFVATLSSRKTSADAQYIAEKEKECRQKSFWECVKHEITECREHPSIARNSLGAVISNVKFDHDI